MINGDGQTYTQSLRESNHGIIGVEMERERLPVRHRQDDRAASIGNTDAVAQVDGACLGPLRDLLSDF